MTEWLSDGNETLAHGNPDESSRRVEHTPEQLFYAAACALSERVGVEPRYVELFRDDVADPEAVDTLADRDPGMRIALGDLRDPVGYVASLAAGAEREHVWSQVFDQLPSLPAVIVPIRGTVE